MYSALKHKGQRLYELARAGVEVERAPRPITLHSISLEAFEAPLLRFSVHCTKGTYVRVLGADIAKALGTEGHLVELCRTGLGPFTDEGMYGLRGLEALGEQGYEALDEVLLPVDSALAHLPVVALDEAARDRLLQGQPAPCADHGPRPTGEAVRTRRVFPGYGRD